ncbi:MAG: hypothetical protein EBR82_64850 [Caulobacteraceae bacterium]|nr:hypothetical protein [Caulobacteraceae bacterium]
MAAIYTTPRTWAAGEVVTASLLNTHLRDMMDFWYSGKNVLQQTNHNLGPYTTTSTSITDINAAFSLTGTITTGRALVYVGGSLSITGSAAYTVTLSLDVDGTSYQIGGTSTVIFVQYLHIVTGLSVGSRTFKLRWLVSNALGTATFTGGLGSNTAPISFAVVEL